MWSKNIEASEGEKVGAIDDKSPYDVEQGEDEGKEERVKNKICYL
jgi:hypothetical protein